MDAITLLKEDHKKVGKLLAEAEETTEKAVKTRQKLFEEIRTELSHHETIEEKLFYPPLKEYEETRSLIFEAFEEHALMDHVVSELEDTDYDSEEWTARLTVLKEVVRHHVEEEETDLFPKVRKILSAEKLKALGEKMFELKQQLIAKDKK